MLRNTFQRILNRTSAAKEALLWRQGILTWNDILINQPIQRTLFTTGCPVEPELDRAIKAFQSANFEYFVNILPKGEHFRIPLSYPERTLFVDIETTGLSRYYDHITMVGWAYRGVYDVYIKGHSETALRRVFAEAGSIVTFNGSHFDIPFLRQTFNDLQIPAAHIDLRFLCKRVGLSGGQKSIEVQLGFQRHGLAAEVGGEGAPVLWHRYRRGDMDAMRLLVEYNKLDIEGMLTIFDFAVDKLLKIKQVPQALQMQTVSFSRRLNICISTEQNSYNDRQDATIYLPKCIDAVCPPIDYHMLLPHCNGIEPTVVGIDLTGSESKPSGLCFLNKGIAQTLCVKTDDELIAKTLETNPSLVSIDSPLSLPAGRLSVFDDDPGRYEYGIMRTCERELKRRGINVYPALIPSMQRLTSRGIRLAAHLRSLGVPVIESYPGAAQDIMGIPRKRASLEMLRQGLGEFGVGGNFQHQTVTHDELDAITSAIVGLFFWSGWYESLGDGHDEALIIPRLRTKRDIRRERFVIGISGRMASGKTTAAEELRSNGYNYFRYSKVLEDILVGRGESPNRDRLQSFGAEVHDVFGQRWLGNELLSRFPETGDIVIDGLRFPDDHAFWVEHFGPWFVHIHISAPESLRVDRFEARDRSGKPFKIVNEHPVERLADKMEPLSRFQVINDQSIGSFKQYIRKLSSDHLQAY
jgi:uncharacterized protein YprB with RNaseH-like and TPR domain/predicted nuclease with RNAse H fold